MSTTFTPFVSGSGYGGFSLNFSALSSVASSVGSVFSTNYGASGYTVGGYQASAYAPSSSAVFSTTFSVSGYGSTSQGSVIS